MKLCVLAAACPRITMILVMGVNKSSDKINYDLVTY